MKTVLLVLCLMTISMTSFSQEVKDAPVSSTKTPNMEKNSWGAKLKASPFSIGLSLQTKYVWRGMEMIPASYETIYKYEDGNVVEDGYTKSGA